jgi:hypothetical protein
MKTVPDTRAQLFGPLRGHHVALGTAEVYAHLNKVEHEGRAIDRDGRYRLV